MNRTNPQASRNVREFSNNKISVRPTVVLAHAVSQLSEHLGKRRCQIKVGGPMFDDWSVVCHSYIRCLEFNYKIKDSRSVELTYCIF